MRLYVFCMIVLSIVFMLIFGTWWDGNAPFKIHLAVLAVAMATTLSALMMIAIYPIFSLRTASEHKKSGFDSASWGSDISRNLSTPAVVLDGYNIVFANSTFLAELGLSGISDQIVGSPITNLIHPRDHLQLANFIGGMAQDNHNLETIRLRFLCYDGTTLLASMSLSPLRQEGKSDLNLLQFSPTSSAIRPENRQSENSNCQLLIDHIEQVVFQINVDHEIIFLNPSWQRLLDYEVDDSLNKSLITFIHPEDKPLAETRINSLTLGKRTHCAMEIRLIAKNGDAHWMELRAKTTSLSKGERTSVIGTLTDIDRMKNTEASLRANRRSLSTLLGNIPGMVYRCKNDRYWSFEFASDGCLDVTGYEPYEIINSPNFSFNQIIHRDDRAYAWESVQKNIALQQTYQLMYRIITRSGKTKWVWELGKGIYSSVGELLALEGFITELINDSDYETLLAFQKTFTRSH